MATPKSTQQKIYEREKRHGLLVEKEELYEQAMLLARHAVELSNKAQAGYRSAELNRAAGRSAMRAQQARREAERRFERATTSPGNRGPAPEGADPIMDQIEAAANRVVEGATSPLPEDRAKQLHGVTPLKDTLEKAGKMRHQQLVDSVQRPGTSPVRGGLLFDPGSPMALLDASEGATGLHGRAAGWSPDGKSMRLCGGGGRGGPAGSPAGSAGVSPMPSFLSSFSEIVDNAAKAGKWGNRPATVPNGATRGGGAGGGGGGGGGGGARGWGLVKKKMLRKTTQMRIKEIRKKRDYMMQPTRAQLLKIQSDPFFQAEPGMVLVQASPKKVIDVCTVKTMPAMVRRRSSTNELMFISRHGSAHKQLIEGASHRVDNTPPERAVKWWAGRMEQRMKDPLPSLDLPLALKQHMSRNALLNIQRSNKVHHERMKKIVSLTHTHLENRTIEYHDRREHERTPNYPLPRRLGRVRRNKAVGTRDASGCTVPEPFALSGGSPTSRGGGHGGHGGHGSRRGKSRGGARGPGRAAYPGGKEGRRRPMTTGGIGHASKTAVSWTKTAFAPGVDTSQFIVRDVAKRTREELKKHHQTLTACFRNMDKNADNQVSLAEMKRGFEVEAHVALSDDDAKALFKAFDTDGGGSVDLREMMKTFRKIEKEGDVPPGKVIHRPAHEEEQMYFQRMMAAGSHHGGGGGHGKSAIGSPKKGKGGGGGWHSPQHPRAWRCGGQDPRKTDYWR